MSPSRIIVPLMRFGLVIALSSAASAQSTFDEVARPFVRQYCAECHGTEVQEGGLSLTGYSGDSAVRGDFEVWDYVRERVEFEDMPPSRSPQPTDEERAAFLAWLDSELEGSFAQVEDDPGRPVLRRLNNAQYENAIRDLFGVQFPARERFPTDGIGAGFDTVGEALSMPELRLEKAIDAAEEIAAQVFVPANDLSVQRLDPEDFSGRGSARGNHYHMPFGADVIGRATFSRDGRYKVRMLLGATHAGDDFARVAVVVNDVALDEVEVPDLPIDAKVHEFELTLKGTGDTKIAARFLNDYYDKDFPDPKKRDRNLAVGWIEVEGPLDPAPPSAFQAELFERVPDESDRMQELVRRVWRRPAADSELRRLRLLTRDLDDPATRMQLALTVLLASPNFLYYVEPDPTGSEGVRALEGHELAARLAAFLWNSVPGRRLDALADAGELTDPTVYAEVVESMLEDPRAEAFARDFCAQWLGTRALADAAPDPSLFPTFSPELAAAMEEETLRLFTTVLAEDLPVTELLSADWTFLNGALADHYGIEVEGGVEVEARDDFSRVSLEGTPRRGLLGHASVLTVTSETTRTSPVKRGKWVLESLLASPPPSPPPGADSLPDVEPGEAKSQRERLEAHREDPTCAVCHDRMDPLGFGLENFDAVGRYREADGELPIDSSGVLPGGVEFDGPVELASFLEGDRRFPRAVGEKLLVYATGRPLTRADRRRVEEWLVEDGTTLRNLVLRVTQSSAFTSKRVEE